MYRTDDLSIKNNTTSLNRDTLLDAFDVLYNECNKDALKNHNANILDFTKKCRYLYHSFPFEFGEIKKFEYQIHFSFRKVRDPLGEVKKMRVKAEDFTIKSLIGKGYFGEVHLAIENVTLDVYAIKKIPKTTFAQSKEERNVMAINRSEWIPTLQYAFQVNSNTFALNRQQHI